MDHDLAKVFMFFSSVSFFVIVVIRVKIYELCLKGVLL